MGDPRGFLRFDREGPKRRPVAERLQDWKEVYLAFPREKLTDQATRCMDCGIPFCHEGCPLANLIPEWNDLVSRRQFDEAAERLHATNNFPEFTGRLCPAPCEGSCVLGIAAEPVAIKQVEYEIAEWARGKGLSPAPVSAPTGRKVAVVGSGPAGLAAAQQLTRAGHEVVVFERAEEIGGLLRFGVPEFKMEKKVVKDRVAQMQAEGTVFRTRTAIGAGATSEVALSAAADATVISATTLASSFDAIVLAIGSTRPRDLDVVGRHLDGVHYAMNYLKQANLVCEGLLEETAISAKDKHVVIIGGGDTGADCLGTVHRQRAASVVQLEILPEPPQQRRGDNPWPTWPVILRSSAAHEEGGGRLYSINTSEFVADDQQHVKSLRTQAVEQVVVDGRVQFEPVANSTQDLPADLVLLALGFVGAEQSGVVAELGCDLSPRGTIVVDDQYMSSVRGVFACGDAVRGQSLIVWAIAEGRSVATEVDTYLMGSTDLPKPLVPGSVALA